MAAPSPHLCAPPSPKDAFYKSIPLSVRELYGAKQVVKKEGKYVVSCPAVSVGVSDLELAQFLQAACEAHAFPSVDCFVAFCWSLCPIDASKDVFTWFNHGHQWTKSYSRRHTEWQSVVLASGEMVKEVLRLNWTLLSMTACVASSPQDLSFCEGLASYVLRQFNMNRHVPFGKAWYPSIENVSASLRALYGTKPVQAEAGRDSSFLVASTHFILRVPDPDVAQFLQAVCDVHAFPSEAHFVYFCQSLCRREGKPREWVKTLQVRKREVEVAVSSAKGLAAEVIRLNREVTKKLKREA